MIFVDQDGQADRLRIDSPLTLAGPLVFH
jgi:hypothetical protein